MRLLRAVRRYLVREPATSDPERWVVWRNDNTVVAGAWEKRILDLADGRTVEALSLSDPTEGAGVNTRQQLARAEASMQEWLRDHWMTMGVTMHDPATTYLGVDVELAEDVVLWPNTLLQGSTRIGAGTEVGPNARIVDSVIAERCRVGSSALEGVVLEPEVSVGPYCHLRQGTYLERTVSIGSHVEIKNSRIGTATRVGHFCYLGDASLGPGVNVGAGTVTCNYDGVDKHLTII